jgi:peptide/nickel transport system substrate-binding protein
VKNGLLLKNIRTGALYLKISAVTLLLILPYVLITPMVSAQLEPSDDTVVIALGTHPSAFDPQYTFGMSNLGMIRLVCETLVKIDQVTGEVLPVLATAWETDANAVNWTITIREGVKFHDGSELTAEDVKYTLWDRVASPSSGAFVQKSFGPPGGPIISMEVVDTYKVKIQTAGYADLMPYFNYQPSEIVSKARCDELSRPDETRPAEDFQNNPSGTGPYKFVKWVEGDYIQYVRNDDYWGPKPAFENVIYKKITEASSRVAALLAGDVDYIHGILPTDISVLEADDDVYIIEGTPTRMMHIGLFPGFEPFADRRVRQALNFAVNQTQIVKTIYAGTGEPMINTYLAPTAYGVQPGNISYNQNVAKAEELLDAAGYTVDPATGNRFEFTLIYGAGRYVADQQISEAVQSFLADVDVKMNIESHEWASYSALTKMRNQTEIIAEDFQAWFSGFGNPWMNADGALKNFMSQGAVLEPIFYNNSHFDDLFFESRTETDETAKFALYEEMTDIAMTDANWIFLAIQPNVHAAKRVQNITTYHDETVDISGAYLPSGTDAPGFGGFLTAISLILGVVLLRKQKKRK